MSADSKRIHKSDPFKQINTSDKGMSHIYNAEVISITDDTDGGRIRVRIPVLDNKIANDDLVFCYPLLPKFFHVYPKVGEIVRIFIPDMRKNQSSRFWIGSVISQLQNINFDTYFQALSTTDLNLTRPKIAESKIPNAKGVFPEKDAVALIGRDNTDVILKTREVEIRAGKHEFDNVLSLNKVNPSVIKLNFDKLDENDTLRSSNVMIADKIALISHDGIPKFKSTGIDQDERTKIFNEGHPVARGDTLVEALEIIRTAILTHKHPWHRLEVDDAGIVKDLKRIDFNQILQPNIVVN